MKPKETKFQKNFLDKLRQALPGITVLKNDSSYIQGFPDWTILYKKKWAILEMKRDRGADRQPNQPYYVDQLNRMSFSRFVSPENAEEVFEELISFFKSKRR